MYYSVSELEKAVMNREVDIVLSEAGVAARLRMDGARPLLSAVSLRHPDPKRSQGSVFFARNDRKDLTNFETMKGKRLAATSPNDFTGFQAAIGEIVQRGHDPEHFFDSVHFVGNASKLSQQAVVEEVLDGRVDVGVVRTCFLEDLETMRQTDLQVKVIGAKLDPKFACQRSTELYPNWTISSVPSMTADDLRLVVEVLLSMPKTNAGMYWSVATDFSALDRLMKDLKIGPYEQLRQITFERLWEEYGWIVLALIAALIILGLHTRRTTHLLNKRTQELEASFAERERLKIESLQMETKFERMQRSTMVGQMSNIFVHELKQPLQAIAGFSHGLLRLLDTQTESKEIMKEGLERIAAEIDEAGGIIERVRSYAKGRNTDRCEITLLPVVKASVELMRHAHPSVSISFSEKAPVQGTIQADELELRIIFHNVLKNAAEAAEASAHPAVQVSCCVQDGLFQLSVTDNGPSLTDEALDAMLSPLQTTKPDGLGLGLSVTRGLLEKYKGHLIFTRHNVGLTAIVSIPLASGGAS